MRRLGETLVRGWIELGPRFLPFADAASRELPLGRLLRLSLFQVSVGMTAVLLNGTLNRVTIVELGVPASLVAVMVALPFVFAPLRALIGFRSDTYESALGWRRVPFIWMGSLLQFGGIAIMPFALLVLSGDTHGPVLIGQLGAALAFLLVGAGVHTAQTAGLALATDLAPAHARPRVVALLYVMLLLGMVASSLVFSLLLAQFSALRLIQVVQGAALVAMLLNGVALWKQEPRKPRGAAETEAGATFREAWRGFARRPRTRRFLLALGLGTAAFSMQDILLEPYGGEILALPVAATTGLTAFLAIGALAAFALAAKRLGGGADPCRLAAAGAVIGLAAFAAVLFAPAIESATLFRTGTALIGFGGGLFSVGMLAAAMSLEASGLTGLALGAWGAVHATATGLAVGAGGVLRDAVGALASQGALGATLAGPATAYGFVYLVEILLLFATLIAAGPLVQGARAVAPPSPSRFGLAEFPG